MMLNPMRYYKSKDGLRFRISNVERAFLVSAVMDRQPVKFVKKKKKKKNKNKKLRSENAVQ